MESNIRLNSANSARASPENSIKFIFKPVFLKAFICLVFFSGIYLFSAGSVSAATLYWVGADAANTSVASNWKTTNPAACGSGDAGAAPASGDIATFDPDCDNGATVDSAFSVQGINIVSGYVGTITVNAGVTVGSSSFIQADGIWTGNAQTLDINDGSFTVSGGTHTATTGTWSVERSFTSSGGTLTMTGATVTFDGSDSTDDSTLTCTGSLGGTVNLAKTGRGDFTNSSGCTVTIGSISGDFETITNDGTFNHTGSTFDINSDITTGNGNLTNSSGATMTFSGTAITIEANFTQSGTFDLTGKTITFDGSDSGDDSTLTCSGSLGGSVVISKTGKGDFTNSSGCTVTVTSVSADIGTLINNGILNHTGSTFNLDSNISTGGGNLTNFASSTMTYSGTAITIEGSFTQSGTFDLTGKTITFDGSDSGDDSALTCSGSLGGTVNIAKTGLGDFTNSTGCTVTVGSVSTTST